jgi:tripartite-type tricarboxylate transporter receptor subunit TctC
LNHDIAQALAQPDVRAFFASIGAEPGNMSPNKFDRFFQKATDRLGRLMSTLGLKNE